MNTRRFVPIDPVLPALGCLVDETAVSAALQPVLTLWHARPCRIRSVEIERVKYRPGRNCLVGYRLWLECPGEARPIEQRATLAMHDRAEATARHAKARAEFRGDAAASPVAFVPEWHAIARAFPSDRKLAGLARLAVADEALATHLPPLVARRWSASVNVRRASHAVVSYFPEHTCTIAIDAAVEHCGSGRPEAWRVFGKLRHDDAGADTVRVMDALWNSDAHRNGDVGYARPLAHDAAERVLWQEGVPAPTLHALLATGTSRPDTLRRVARAVAALHRTPGVALRADPREEVMDAIAGAAAIVARAAPALAAQVDSLARSLVTRSRSVGTAPNATLHGDLHSRNILVAPDRVHLIDLDRVTNGDAFAELGSLLAEFAYRSCVRDEPVDASTLATIVDGYFADGVHDDVAATLAWHCAAALLHERAKRVVTSLKPGTCATLRAALDTARWAIEHPRAFQPRARLNGVAA